ncbi:flagellar hook-associated protein FlgL [Pallidibacillus thermolactis]|jgi:flagellar hook-associated protein 3 FlgL|uniref:flagellar hook-associated protein FlgL n=1 Tax=Pallidibacillus thermolactis TaxID=251051 RepID=UPI0021DA840D|nr:flagellar hook-associated protein FlgL [Pallidibacillus thermolactis]MCU9600034.1 flagellar hook-associated protein FlgL [Pallidibacillus thermolactis subsp. kokeshiiformis]
MRVTQSMLSTNMLRNLSNSYNKLGKLQEQLATQKKINRPSDDPVVAMLGVGYRGDLNQVQQFNRNISEVNNWLETTDDAIAEGISALQRIRELTLQATNGTYDEGQREAIAVEVKQLQEQLYTIARTQVGDKYIFNGKNTNNAPEIVKNTDETIKEVKFNDGVINIEIFDGITIDVNTSGKTLFENLLHEDGTLSQLIKKLEDPNVKDEEIGDFLSKMDQHIDIFLKEQARVGAKQNRVEMMEDRIAQQEVTATKILSENEDVDMERVITELLTQESIHRAALSVGAKIIQPTLVDFLR